MPGLTDDTPARPILPQPRMGLFAHPGGMAVNPHGGPLGPVEHCQGMSRNGYGWVVFNAFDGRTKPEDWEVWAREAIRNRLPWGWWARCYNVVDLEYLAALSQRDVRTLVVFNCENELADDSIREEDVLRVAEPLQQQGCQVGVSSVSPLYHSVEWQRLTHAGVVVLPQAFMNYEPTTTGQGAYDQAHARGAGLVNCTLGLNKTPSEPDGLTVADYQPLPPYWSVYPVDVVERWA